MVYALICQNTFFQRWHAIQLVVTPTPFAQIDTSFHNPNPIEKAILPRRKDIPYVSNLAPTTKSTQAPTHLSVNLILSQHTLQEIHQVLIATPNSNTCSKVHICHPVLPITIKHLHTLQRTIHSGQYHNIFNRTLFYHLRITVLSPLVPPDRLLYITIDNIIYALTSTGTTNVDTPYRLHLFLNPHNRMLYLRHTHTKSMSGQHAILRSQLFCPVHVPHPRDQGVDQLYAPQHIPSIY